MSNKKGSGVGRGQSGCASIFCAHSLVNLFIKFGQLGLHAYANTLT